MMGMRVVFDGNNRDSGEQSISGRIISGIVRRSNKDE
jgi:hypothetical protein